MFDSCNELALLSLALLSACPSRWPCKVPTLLSDHHDYLAALLAYLDSTALQVAQGVLDHTNSVLGTSQHLSRRNLEELVCLRGAPTATSENNSGASAGSLLPIFGCKQAVTQLLSSVVHDSDTVQHTVQHEI